MKQPIKVLSPIFTKSINKKIVSLLLNLIDVQVVDDNCIRCPFHGWIFSGETGECVRIPYSSGTIPGQARVSEDG